MNNTSIIILTYNNLQYNKDCINSIRSYTPKDSYEIVVVDNNSTDGTAQWLEEQNDIKSILNKENKGFPAGCNQGIKAAAEGNDILLLNNDTVVTPNWLENLQTCLYSEKSIGAVGPVTNSCSNFQAITTDYKNTDEMIAFAKTINVSNPLKWEERVRLIGFCLLIKNEVIKKIGLLDEIYGKGNCEDDDYSLRMRKSGYRLMLCGDCFIHHYGSLSFSKLNHDFVEVLQANKNIFKRKWGFDPFLIAIDERFVLNNYINRIKGVKNILVVNSSAGSMLLYLKKKFPKSDITGIETNKLLPIGLSHVAEVFNDFSEIKGKKFSLVIMLTDYRSDIDISPQLEYLPAFLKDAGTLLLLSEEDVLKKYASHECFKGYHKKYFAGMCRISKMDIPEISGEKQFVSLLRLIEDDVEVEESTEELGKLLVSIKYSKSTIESLVNKYIARPEVAFNAVGTALFTEGKRQLALDMFADAFEKDNSYYDSAFNLAYLLYELKEKNLALNVIEKCGAADEEMLKLKQAVMSLE